MEHLSQYPGLGLEGREEESRRLAMVEWIFVECALMNTREGGRRGLDLNPRLFYRQLICAARGVNVKTPWLFAFV